MTSAASDNEAQRAADLGAENDQAADVADLVRIRRFFDSSNWSMMGVSSGGGAE